MFRNKDYFGNTRSCMNVQHKPYGSRIYVSLQSWKWVLLAMFLYRAFIAKAGRISMFVKIVSFPKILVRISISPIWKATRTQVVCCPETHLWMNTVGTFNILWELNLKCLLSISKIAKYYYSVLYFIYAGKLFTWRYYYGKVMQKF